MGQIDSKKSVTAREEIEEAGDASFLEDFSSSDYESGASSNEDVSPHIGQSHNSRKNGRHQRHLESYTVDAINDREDFIKARVF